MIEKLIKIQQNLKAPKGQYNDFGKYSYRSCEDIFEAVKPLLEEENLTLRLNDELVQVGDRYYIKATAILTDGTETIENTSYAGEEETKKGMDGSQITGASSSYARKYALNGLFLIDDVKDSDTTNGAVEPTKEDAKNWMFTFGKHNGETMDQVINEDLQYVEWFISQKASDYDKKCYELLTGEKLPTDEELKERTELLAEFQKLIIKTNAVVEDIYEYYNVTNNTEMTTEQLKEAVDHMKKKVK